jgi:arylsulfatase
MKVYPLYVMLLASCWLSCQPKVGDSPPLPPPNIIYILADDMGYGDLGCYGSEIRTPHLDQLAAEGVRMTQLYNTGRCCPTRASLLTGLYPHQAGIGHMMSDRGVAGYRGDLHPYTPTIAEVLRPAGYGTYLAGKWHVTRHASWGDSTHNWPNQRGFDRAFGMIKGAGSFYDTTILYLDGQPAQGLGPNSYLTDAITDHALQFMEAHAQTRSEDPFFLYLAFTAPHWPLQAPAEEIEAYAGVYEAGWDQLRAQRYARMKELGVIDPAWGMTPRDSVTPPWQEAPHQAWEARRMATYAAMVTRMDRNIGRLIADLKARGQWENTLVVFLSDNGACAEDLPVDQDWVIDCCAPTYALGGTIHVGNDSSIPAGADTTFMSYGRPWAQVSTTPFRRYKHWTDEGGIRTPGIIHYPAAMQGQGRWQSTPGHLIDLMATALDASGAAYPSTFAGQATPTPQGQSILPLLAGQAMPERAIFFEHEGNRAIRKGQWKLASRSTDDYFEWADAEELPRQGWALYDMAADGTEQHDVAADHPELVAALSQEWWQWAQQSEVFPKQKAGLE